MDRIQKLREFLAASPTDEFLKHALALEYVKLGDDPQAQTLFEEILTVNPGYIGSYYHLAKLMERSGDTESAVHWYQKGMDAAGKAGDSHAFGELRSALEELIY